MESKNLKKIMIIDDSALMRRVMSDIIESDNRFQVVSAALNGVEGLAYVKEQPHGYDAIVLDINMPLMNGLEFMEQLNHLEIHIPILLVSTLAREGAEETVRALELGAFDFVTKPGSFLETKSESFKDEILKKLVYATGLAVDSYEMIAAQVKLPPEVHPVEETEKPEVHHVAHSATGMKHEPIVKTAHEKVPKTASKLVAIACSTGGPKALQQVIPKLPKDLDAPVVLVQHMPEGFTESLALRLDSLSEIHVKEAENGEILNKGTVYIAKGGTHLRLKTVGSQTMIVQNSEEPARSGLKPCADIMYESLTETEYDDYICVVLTGMGGDGTLGIKKMNETKNMYVIAQDEATCVVYGMPRVLYEAGLTNEVTALNDIAEAIVRNVGVR